MEIGLIILIAALVVFAAMAAFMLATGFRNQWPEGPRFTSEYQGHKLTLIVDPKVPSGSDWGAAARVFAKALWAVAQADKERGDGKPGDLKEGAVHLLDDAEYESHAGTTLRSSNAYKVNVRRRIGHGPHLVVMRSKLLEYALKSGEPVIHEFVHAAGGDYHHKDEQWWSEFTPSPGSVQAFARDYFKAG